MDELTRDQLSGMKGLAVVEVYRPDCEPCKGLEPILSQLAGEYGDRLQFYKSHFVNGELGQEFELNSNNVPTMVFLQDGKMVEHFPGAKYVKMGSSEREAANPGFLRRRLDKLLDHYLVSEDVSPTLGYPQTMETELGLSENSLVTLRERYLKKDDLGEVIETPEDMFRRVAENIAQADVEYGASSEKVTETADQFYDLMSSLKFLPNSPTLMNAGKDLQQLSACFVLPVEDDMESIFGAAGQGALIHKSGGGTGYSFSRLRPKDSRVLSTSGVASGPVSFIYPYNVYTETVKQGGTRRGANMGILNIDHSDTRGFIHAKGDLNEINVEIVEQVKEENMLDDNDPVIVSLTKKLLERTQLNNFNLSVGIVEGFMDAVKSDGYFELVDPYTGNVTEKVKANDLLEEIVDQSWKTGDPGIVFLDRINEHNPTPHLGRIESTNPCGEQPLLPYESCNLGSINLSNFVEGRDVNWDDLKYTVHTAVHFLDNVIDMNNYPLGKTEKEKQELRQSLEKHVEDGSVIDSIIEEYSLSPIEEMTKKNRKVGLGVMGFADLIAQLRIPYGSEESTQFARKLMKFVRDEARAASSDLAEQRGVFPSWEGSIYDPDSEYFQGEELRLRNASLTTIAPTGSLSQIANVEWGIEPAFSLAYTKTVMDGKVLHYRARGLEHVLKEEGYDSEAIFAELEEGKRDRFEKLPDRIKELARTAMQLTPEQHLGIQAAFQENIDNAVSKTVNFPANATREDIKKAYLLAHDLGCKGLTIYRNESKDVQVLAEKKAQDYDFDSEIPKERLAITREEMVGDGKRIFVTTGYWENDFSDRVIQRLKKDGRPTEFFVSSNFFDPKTSGLITALAIRGSKDLRLGIDPEGIAGDLRDLPASDEIGHDRGFGPGNEYVNRSIPDAIWKSLVGWEPPQKKTEQVQESKPQEKQSVVEEENPNGFTFCSECSKLGVMHIEGCDKCVYCGNSEKGCS